MFKADVSNYIFSAHAIAVSASLDKPVRDFLTEQTCAVLSPSGGYAFQSREKTNFREMIRTGHVSATVIGNSDSDDQFSTLATVTVENLDILGFIKADAIVSRVAARAPTVAAGDTIMHPSDFLFQGSAYHGLKVNGTSYEPKLSDPFTDFPKDQSYKVSADKKTVEVFDDSGKNLLYVVQRNQSYQLIANAVGRKRLFSGVPYATATGPFLEIEEFGRIYLGELLVVKGKATLAMLRVELGCAANGVFNCATSTTNGQDGT